MKSFLIELDALMAKHGVKFIYAEDAYHNYTPITIDNGCDEYVKFNGEINDVTLKAKIKEVQ